MTKASTEKKGEQPRQWLRLPPPLWEKIRVLADANYRTKDLQVQLMVTEWLKQNGEEQDTIREFPAAHSEAGKPAPRARSK